MLTSWAEQAREIVRALRDAHVDAPMLSENWVAGEIFERIARDARFLFIGTFASVFLILLILLRKPVVSAYLILSVLFSYYATLGATFAVFWALDPAGFAGLDWKVAIFLFTILIAVGEDYNIFLLTRVHEEQKVHGPIGGVTEALVKTGGIISSCGFIERFSKKKRREIDARNPGASPNPWACPKIKLSTGKIGDGKGASPEQT